MLTHIQNFVRLSSTPRLGFVTLPIDIRLQDKLPSGSDPDQVTPENSQSSVLDTYHKVGDVLLSLDI